MRQHAIARLLTNHRSQMLRPLIFAVSATCRVALPYAAINYSRGKHASSMVRMQPRPVLELKLTVALAGAPPFSSQYVGPCQARRSVAADLLVTLPNEMDKQPLSACAHRPEPSRHPWFLQRPQCP